MEMIGYNVAKINEMLENIKESYASIKGAITNNWPALSNTLGTEWIGPDEVAFEKELAKRVNKLYSECAETINTTIDNVMNIGQKWKEFQMGNKLENGTVEIESSISEIKAEKVTAEESIVSAAQRTFSADTNLGLANGGSSAGTIMDAAQDYVKRIKNTTSRLYDQVGTSSAFLGDIQSASIQKYLNNIGTSLGRLNACIKDLHDALTNMAGVNWTKSEQGINDTKFKIEEEGFENELTETK